MVTAKLTQFSVELVAPLGVKYKPVYMKDNVN